MRKLEFARVLETTNLGDPGRYFPTRFRSASRIIA
jgi:hypothetical protein